MIKGKRVKVKGINGEELNVLPAEAPIIEAMNANQKKAEKSGYNTKEEKSAPDNKQSAPYNKQSTPANKQKPGPKQKA